MEPIEIRPRPSHWGNTVVTSRPQNHAINYPHVLQNFHLVSARPLELPDAHLARRKTRFIFAVTSCGKSTLFLAFCALPKRLIFIIISLSSVPRLKGSYFVWKLLSSAWSDRTFSSADHDKMPFRVKEELSAKSNRSQSSTFWKLFLLCWGFTIIDDLWERHCHISSRPSLTF